MRTRIGPLLRDRVFEPFLLLNALRVARSYTPEQALRLRALAEATRRRVDASYELRDERSVTAALVLQREAFALAVTALLVARTEHTASDVLSPAEAWARLSAVIESGRIAPPPHELEQARELLASDDALAIDRLTADAQRQARAAGETLLRWLQDSVEARTVATLRRQRAMRLAVLVFSIVVSLVVAVAWLGAPPNIALGKPAAQSSRRPGTPPASRAVDGIKDGSFGFVTNRQQSPWLRIDLLETRKICRVIVYNREDGYFDGVLPLVFELSEDGKTWREIARRTTRFTESNPWKIKLASETGRYLRLRKEGTGELWASEVEVFECR